MYKIAIVGDPDSVIGFKAAGYAPFPVKDGEEAAAVIKTLANQDYIVIFITESVFKGAEHALELFRERITPAIIPIPDNRGGTGIGMDMVKKAVERAVGADILKQD